MNSADKYHFKLLKKAIETTFSRKKGIAKAIENWKGEDISLFQEDLFLKVKARVSEKWFYTYFKNDISKLPRIDMLNILSRYVEYENWNAFVVKHLSEKKSQDKKIISKPLIIVGVTILVISILLFTIKRDNEFHFCFKNAIDGEAITKSVLDIKVINKNESPLYFKTDSLGCFSFKTKEKQIKLIVKSPYYKTDTIVRDISSNTNDIIKLQTDDYALMLRYYTSGNIKDWKKHKINLQKLIADNAIIYQLYDESIGIEIFSKEDFIRLLTIPTSSLKRIKILDKEFDNGRIVKLKFTIQ